MLSPTEVGDRVALMVEARAAGEDHVLLDLLDQTLTGPRGDSLNVALVLAGVLAEDLGDDPEGGFHRVEVSHSTSDGGSQQGSAQDLPAEVATFLQMVVAIANNDRSMARDLFLGFVGDSGPRALALLILAINEVVHANFGSCPHCTEGKRRHA
jgi:hypothetical protein